MNISDFCKSNIKLLQDYKTSKEDLLYETVKVRLNKSFKSYEEELDKSLQYLSRREEIKLAKKINRMSKQNAKSNK